MPRRRTASESQGWIFAQTAMTPVPRALPARFRRPRVLIVGCGDVGLRAAAALRARCRVLALSSQDERLPLLRAAGVTPLRGNLDAPASLRRLAALAPRVLHLAPPPSEGGRDPRTRHLTQALARSRAARRLVYGSTSGVYGDAKGAWVTETRPVAPATDRARRRVDAEACLRAWGQTSGRCVSVLRIPGIYALDRVGGDPRERLRRGTPVLQAVDDIYTNHIHADDLARACIAALWRGRPGRVVHACDHTVMRMGDYFDGVADRFGLPRPPRVSREDAARLLSPMQRSFLGESRRLRNDRLITELRVWLRHPTIWEGL